MLDLSTLDQERRRWIPLEGALAGVEIEIRHAGPKDQERFRQKMMHAGIFKDGQINRGREADFFRAYAETFVTDWRGEIRPDGAPYNPIQMGAVLGAYQSAFEALTRALGDEVGFFSGSANGSTPS